MEFAGVNYIAVLCAAVAGMVTGAIWYGVFAKQWMKAVGFEGKDIEQKPSLYIVAAIAQLIIAYMLAGVIGHLDTYSLSGGVITAIFCWFGFVVTTMAVNHRFQAKGWDLTIIDGGYWLAVMLLQGAVIGWFGV